MKLPIDCIVVSKDNPRQSFDEDGLRRLGESIKEHGQLQQIVVRPKGSQYELVVGERRLRACALVGLLEIEAMVRDVDDVKAMELRLIENTQREDLTESEKGNAIAHLLADFPEKYPTIKVLAKKLEKTDTTVYKWLQKSEKLSNEVKKFISGNKLSDRVACRLLIFDHITQNKIAEAIIRYEIPRQKDDVESRGEFINRYQLNPDKYPTIESLESLANEVKGIKKVKIDLGELSPEARSEVERKLEEAKEEAKKLRKKRKKTRVNRRRQGRPKKRKAKPKTQEPKEEKKTIPEPTIPVDTKTVSIALSFPEPLWEKIHRYITKGSDPILFEDAVISLLESHPSLRGL